MEKIKSLRFLVVLGALVIALVGCTFEGNSYSPEEVINNAMKKEVEPLSYYGEAEMLVDMDGEKETTTIKEWRSTDGKSRMEIKGGELIGETIMVNDAEQLITYEKNEKTAMVFTGADILEQMQISPKEQALGLLELVQETHNLSSEGEEKIAGRKAYHLKATAKEVDDLMGNIEIWVDKENWFVLKAVTTMGGFAMEVTYSKIDFKAKITDDLFVLDLPDDVELIDLDDLLKAEETTLSGAAESLKQEFQYFAEVDGLEISSVTENSFGDMFDEEQMEETDYASIEIEYTKDDVPYLTLSVEKSYLFDELENQFGEEDGEFADVDLFDGEVKIDVRGVEGTFIDLDFIRMAEWEEDGLSYTVILTDPEITAEDIQALAAKMILAE